MPEIKKLRANVKMQKNPGREFLVGGRAAKECLAA